MARSSQAPRHRPIQLTNRDDAISLYQTIWEQTVREGEVLAPLQSLANAFGYEFDPVLRDVIDLSLGELQKISRFGGNMTIAHTRKGNTAQHVLQGTLVACFDLVEEFQEFLLPPHMTGRRIWEEYKPDYINHMIAHLPNVLHSVFMQFLSHDDGEKLFEPASVTQNVNDNLRKDWPVLERRIAYLGVVLALYAHENFKIRDDKKAFYAGQFTSIRTPAKDYFEKMKDDLKAGIIDEEVFANTVTQHIITRFIEPVEREFGLNMVAGRYQNFVDAYLSRYDEPEGFGRSNSFTGIYTKIGQKNHSVMHINEHHGLDGGVPHEYVTSALTIASLGYAENMLPQLYQSGDKPDPIQHRVARRATQRVYETNLQMTRMMPAVIDLSKDRRAESPTQSFKRIGEIQALIERAVGEDGDMVLLPYQNPINIRGSLRTCFQLQARYGAALAELKANPDYRPEDEPLYAQNIVDSVLVDRLSKTTLGGVSLYHGPSEDDLQSFTRGRWLGRQLG